MAPPATKNHHHQQPSSSSSKPPKPTTSTTQTIPQNPITISQQDQFLSRATHLTRHELLKRRSHNLKQLIRCYRDHYWVLMEELKTQYKNYYWKFGVSPFKQTQQNQNDSGDGVKIEGGVSKINELGLIKSGDRHCCVNTCKLNAMALTNYCHLHILSDPKQSLYKPCDYVIRSCPTPIVCSKPILRSTVPSLCASHFQKAQKHVVQALKRAGLDVSSSNKLAPKFHVIVVEYVRQIQAKRRAAARADKSKVIIKEASAS